MNSSSSTSSSTSTTDTNTASSTVKQTIPVGIEKNVYISNIFYNGLVPDKESDEYVEITNNGTIPMDLKGWTLSKIYADSHPFTFPAFTLGANTSIRVYTNQIHPEYGGFSFGSERAIWNNTEPGTAILTDSQGREISRKSYIVEK